MFLEKTKTTPREQQRLSMEAEIFGAIDQSGQHAAQVGTEAPNVPKQPAAPQAGAGRRRSQGRLEDFSQGNDSPAHGIHLVCQKSLLTEVGCSNELKRWIFRVPLNCGPSIAKSGGAIVRIAEAEMY